MLKALAMRSLPSEIETGHRLHPQIDGFECLKDGDVQMIIRKSLGGLSDVGVKGSNSGVSGFSGFRVSGFGGFPLVSGGVLGVSRRFSGFLGFRRPTHGS